MGMFDDIIVPKSYLRGLLDKKQEKLLKGYHVFQTKSLENTLSVYKVYAQYLYRVDVPHGKGMKGLSVGPQFRPNSSFASSKKTPREWGLSCSRVNESQKIVFYDTVKDKKENEWWLEFEFTFDKGKLDKKELISCKLETTKEKRDSIDKMWDTEQEIFNEYRKCFRYRFFAKFESIFLKLTNWARKKHQIPLELRKKAYEKSGRLEFDPDSLKLYIDN